MIIDYVYGGIIVRRMTFPFYFLFSKWYTNRVSKKILLNVLNCINYSSDIVWIVSNMIQGIIQSI